MEQLAPYGEGNPEPKFIVQDVALSYVNLLKNGHISCIFTDLSGQRLNAIAFKVADTELGQALLKGLGERFHILGTLKKDTWKGQTKVQFQLSDLMKIS